MDSHPDPIGLHPRRTWWPSAATCAFLASGLEIFSFVLFLLQRSLVLSPLQRSRVIESAGSTPSLGLAHTGVVFAEFIVVFLGVAVEATALWGVGRRQRAVAPISARLGQWAVATYVVSAPLFVLIVLPIVGVYGVWSAAVGNWVFRVALSPLTLAFGCLGWASRGGTGPRQRWANGGLLAVATFGVFSLTWRLFGLPTGQRWLWVGSLDVALRAATWVAVGAWLRSTMIVSQSGDSRDGFANQA